MTNRPPRPPFRSAPASAVAFSVALGLAAMLSSAGCPDTTKSGGTGAAGTGAGTGTGTGAGTATASAPREKKPVPADAPVLKVGHYGSLTGQNSAFGVSADNGIKLAAEEINEYEGGLKVGDKVYKVEIVSKDDNSDPNKVEDAVSKLIGEKVVAVLGEVASSRSMRGAVVCEKEKIPMISPASTNPDVTVQGGKVLPYTFRVCFTDDFQGAAAAVFARKTLGWGKVGMLVDKEEDYSKGLAENFRKTWLRLGGKAEDLVERFYSGKDTDYSAQLTVFKSEKVDGLYIPGYYNNVIDIAQQVRNMDLKGKGDQRIVLLGADGWDAKETKSTSKGALEGCYFTNHLAPDDPQTPEEKRFLESYDAKWPGTIDSMAPLGYDSMKLLADAITRAGSLEPAKVRDAIEATKDFKGATGVISIDKATHNADKPMVIVKIAKNKFKYGGKIEYKEAMGK
jgi:branched-chain amino acid transport system substrate-binding protein